MTELKEFLKPFPELAELVSSDQPRLGLIPLIKKEIRYIANHKTDGNESDAMKLLKDGSMSKLD